MGSNITPDNLRGFLIPSAVFDLESIWDAQSSFTQTGGRAGIPEASQISTSMVLSTIGDQQNDVTITTQNGGIAGVNANYTWTDSASVEYGRNWKNIVTSWDYFKFSASAAVGTYTHTDAIQTINGTIFAVSEYNTSAGLYGIAVFSKERSGAVTLVDNLISLTPVSTPNTTGHPIILQLEDESLFVCHFNFSTGDNTNITAYRSYDNGDNWQTITRRALMDNLDISASGYEIHDMRAVASDNVISLFVELTSNTGTTKNHVAQYRSVDSGLTFELVGQVSTNAEGKFHACRSVKMADGYIGLAYITATDQLVFRKIPNPGIRASSSSWSSQEKTIYSGGATWANLVSSELQDGDVCCWYQDNRVFVLAREYNNGRIYGFYSIDEGDTWLTIAEDQPSFINDGRMFDYGAWADRMDQMVAVPFEGRTLLLSHNNHSIHALYLGGYSNVGYPKLVTYQNENQYARWETNYIPVNTPDSSSHWTTAGTGSASVGINGLNIQTAATQSKYYTFGGSLPADFSEGMIMRFRLRVTNGTNVTQNYIAMQATTDDGSNSRMLNLRFQISGFDIRDNSSVLQSVTIDMRQDVEFRISWKGSTAKISYRSYDQKHNKNWTTITVSIPTYATGAGDTLLFGHLFISPAGGMESYWQEFYTSAAAPAGQDPTDIDLIPAPYPAFGDYAYIDGGMSITTKQTPARGEDAYTISPRYDYPIDNVFYEVAMSPRLVWRSINDTSSQQIAFYLDPNIQANEKSYHDTDAIGLHLANINFQNFTIEKWTGSAWSNLTSVNVSSGLSGTFERIGHSIQPNATGTPFYLHHNEAKGWRAKLDDGAGNVKIVKILTNTEGTWGKNTDQKRAILILDTDLSDYSTLPASGQFQLMPDAVTVVIDALDNLNRGNFALRINISVQDTLEGYYQIGNMIYGHVSFPAPQYQRGRTISFNANIQDETTLDNMFYARQMSNGARRVSLAWTEPIDTTQIEAMDPNYWQLSNTSGAHPVANYGDASMVMMGIARQLNNRIPIVYLPQIEKNQDSQVLNRRMHHVYCRLDGSVSIESVIGEEGSSEAFRIGTINLIEVE